MRLSDDFDDKNTGVPLIYMTVGVLLFVGTLVGAVFFMNRTPSKGKQPTPAAAVQESESTEEMQVEQGGGSRPLHIRK